MKPHEKVEEDYLSWQSLKKALPLAIAMIAGIFAFVYAFTAAMSLLTYIK